MQRESSEQVPGWSSGVRGGEEQESASWCLKDLW